MNEKTQKLNNSPTKTLKFIERTLILAKKHHVSELSIGDLSFKFTEAAFQKETPGAQPTEEEIKQRLIKEQEELLYWSANT